MIPTIGSATTNVSTQVERKPATETAGTVAFQNTETAGALSRVENTAGGSFAAMA